MKVSLTSREKNILMVTALVIIYFLFDYFVYEPKNREGKKNNQALEEIDQKIQQHYRHIAGSASIAQEIRLVEKKVNFSKEKVSTSMPPVKFIEQLAGLCQKRNIEILSLKPRERKFPDRAYKQVLIDMDLKADFITVVQFINALKPLPVFTAIDELRIIRDRDSPRLTLRLVLETFFASEMQPEIQS